MGKSNPEVEYKILGISAALPGWKAVLAEEDGTGIWFQDIPCWALVEQFNDGRSTGSRCVMPMEVNADGIERWLDVVEDHMAIAAPGWTEEDEVRWKKMAVRWVKGR